MAASDDDWKKFLQATEDDPDEVEIGDEPEDEPEEEEADAEELSDGALEDDEPEDEEEEEPEGDDSEKSKAKKPKGKKKAVGEYQPRLKQFLNDEGALDAKKIEDAYVESGKNAVELDKQLKTVNGNYSQLLDAIAAKPEAAKTLFGEAGAKEFLQSRSAGDSPAAPNAPKTTDPLLKHVEAQLNNRAKQEYDTFVEDHPEAATDPTKSKLIGEFMDLHGTVYRQQHGGEIPSMKDSLEAAYKYYGWDLGVSEKEKIANAAKKTAATRSTAHAGGKRKATKSEASKAEQFFARKLGVTLK